MFIETSAIVEVLTGGPMAEAVLNRIDASESSFRASPTVEFEATVVIASKLKCAVPAAHQQVNLFLAELGAGKISITPEIGVLAIEAFARYGKGRGHPAQLNFGDCFSYACARSQGLKLLYIGSEFSETDAG